MKLIRYALRKSSLKEYYPLKEEAPLKNIKVLQVETTNFCNTNCIFCPHSKMKRKKEIMSDNVYEKCISECVKNGISEVAISIFGEPLMDKKIFDRIRHAKSKNMYVYLSTNAILLTEDNATKLVKSGVDDVTISLDAFSEHTYKLIRKPGDFKKTVSNIENFIKIRNKLNPTTKKPKIKIGMLVMDETKKEIGRFINFWEGKADEIAIRRLHRWGENKDMKKLLKNALPCIMLWNTLAVLSNGDVTVCCLDYEGKLKVGNIGKDSIKEIWDSEKMKKLRRLHLSDERYKIPFCASCDMENATITNWWYYG